MLQNTLVYSIRTSSARCQCWTSCRVYCTGAKHFIVASLQTLVNRCLRCIQQWVVAYAQWWRTRFERVELVAGLQKNLPRDGALLTGAFPPNLAQTEDLDLVASTLAAHLRQPSWACSLSSFKTCPGTGAECRLVVEASFAGMLFPLTLWIRVVRNRFLSVIKVVWLFAPR